MKKVLDLKHETLGIGCEITDILNSYNKHKNPSTQMYLQTITDGLAIRGFGATRGNIRLSEMGIVTDIVLSNECYKDGGVFNSEDKGSIEESLSKFIGYSIK